MTPLTFSNLSDLHQHLRGVVLVRLVSASSDQTQLVYHMPGRPGDVRLLTVYLKQYTMDYATSEPTELSDWF